VIATVTVVGSAQGQSLADKIRANIPFDFIVADQRFSAGEYLIGNANQDSDNGVMLIHSMKGSANAFRLTIPVSTLAIKDETKLVFHRYGDQYFLSEVWLAGTNTGRMLSESRSEREAKTQNLAANMATQSKTVTVVSGPR